MIGRKIGSRILVPKIQNPKYLLIYIVISEQEMARIKQVRASSQPHGSVGINGKHGFYSID
jgi:hypothetical protein